MKKITLALFALLFTSINAQTLLKDINPAGTIGSNPERLTAVGDKLFFTADDGVNGSELWVSDGTEAGTTLVKDINIGIASGCDPSVYIELIDFNGKLFFAANDGSTGIEPYLSDGTSSGTSKIKEIYGPFLGGNGSYPRFGAVLGDEILFNAAENSSGVANEELGKTDGTEAGTVLVKEINTTARSQPRYLTEMNGKIYFSAADASTGKELWVSDGTENGTSLLKDINPGVGNSQSKDLYKMGDEIFFTAYTFNEGVELWKTDGTTAGTVLVKDIVNGSMGSNPKKFSSAGNKLYFNANGNELWTSDGTSTGTVLISSYVYLNNLITFKDELYYIADDGTYGKELWKYDGSTTQMVLDIHATADAFNSNPSFEVHGSRMFFAANTGVGDYGLWQTDGTTAGTIAVPNQANDANQPAFLTSVGTTLFYQAYDYSASGTGKELYSFKTFSTSEQTETACPSFDFFGTTYSQSGEYTHSLVNSIGYDSIITLKLTIDCGSAINVLDENLITIYPNPATNQLSIVNDELSILKIEIIDVLGKIVKTVTENSNSLNVSDLTKGTYFIKIQTIKGQINKRFVKM